MSIFLNTVVLAIVLAVASASSESINSIEDTYDVNRSFVIDYERNVFLKDGQPFRYISGSVHYFRIMEDYWDGILRKLHLAGLNAVQTYIDWSSHQPSPAEVFDFKGNLNLFKFLEAAQRNNLLVILRPGPFIDAEWDMGGLPAWLLWQKPNMELRTSDLDYVYFVSRWYDHLLPLIKPYLYVNGGPIISIQVENEYGSYDCDRNYTSFLRDLYRFHLGDQVVLFTTDGSGDGYLKCGAVPDVYATVDFGTTSTAGVLKNFGYQRDYEPKGPLVNSEFYPGWLDHWQTPHSTVSSASVVNTLSDMLRVNANVNIYMFYGGTSFGFKAGANAGSDSFQACPTSYDYDAPLNEAGDPTEKYFAIKNAISQFDDVPAEDPVVAPKAFLGKVQLQPFSTFFDPTFLTIFALRPINSTLPLSFEQLKVSSGFVLYETVVDFMVTDPTTFSAPNLKDRAYIFVNKLPVGVLSRSDKIYSVPIYIRKGEKLQILVENQGRVCFGHLINENKGLGSKVTLGGEQLEGWSMWKLGEMQGSKLTKYAHSVTNGAVDSEEGQPPSLMSSLGGPGFYVGNFTIRNHTIYDTFLRLDGWTKGVVWINGFNLGRYWPVVGPQETLYLPAPLLSKGTNTLIVLELEKAPSECFNSSKGSCFVLLTDKHVINASTPLKASSFSAMKYGEIPSVPASPVQGSSTIQLKLRSSTGYRKPFY